MSKVKLNLVSGNTQEKELITAFNCNDVKYVIFDGESTGSMGLPIILVGKVDLGKVVGITDAEEWKNTKDCLKKIIAGEEIEYAAVDGELKADDIYYRQLTLPVASFDVLKSSYVAPDVKEVEQSTLSTDNTPIFDPITPEDVAPNAEAAVEVDPVNNNFGPSIDESSVIDHHSDKTNNEIASSQTDNSMNELKQEFLKYAEEIFDKMYAKINHND